MIPPPLQMSITYQFMYCIFVFFYCSLHQSIILLILIEMAYHLYIFFKTFTMYMDQCVCAYKIQMHNISEIKWYKAVWNIFHPEVWELCIIYFTRYLEIFQKYWYVFFFWKCSICCIFLLIIKMFYFLR